MNNSTAHTALVNEALVWLSSQRVMAWSNRTGFGVTAAGRPLHAGLVGSSDILGCLPPNGRLLCAEAKTGRGTQTDQQKKFQAAISRAGGLYVIFHDLDELALAIEHARMSAASAVVIPTRTRVA